MRISEYEKTVIVDAVKSVDSDARVWLFGSRVDDSKKGGDIDIAVLSAKIKENVMQEIQVRRFICDRIGEQKIDIVTTNDGNEAIFKVAVAKGIELTMTKDSVVLLKENLDSLNLSLNRLMYSFVSCNKTGLSDNYSDDEFVVFEAMTSRYARTTDMLINKVLQSLDAVEYIDAGTVIDAANNTEKRGIADSNDLRKLKDLRNSIAHEYVTENIVRFFGKVLEFTPILKQIIEKLNDYCSQYIK